MLWKQHVYIAQVEVIDAALQMVQVNILGEKDGHYYWPSTCNRSEGTILQPDCKCEGNGVGHHAKHKQKATLECHLLNLTIFVVDLIRSELVWHFWLNSVLVFILSLQKNT